MLSCTGNQCSSLRAAVIDVIKFSLPATTLAAAFWGFLQPLDMYLWQSIRETIAKVHLRQKRENCLNAALAALRVSNTNGYSRCGPRSSSVLLYVHRDSGAGSQGRPPRLSHSSELRLWAMVMTWSFVSSDVGLTY